MSVRLDFIELQLRLLNMGWKFVAKVLKPFQLKLLPLVQLLDIGTQKRSSHIKRLTDESGKQSHRKARWNLAEHDKGFGRGRWDVAWE